MEASDQELVAQVLAGDRRAFAVLYGRHQAVIARRLRRILRHLPDVEDVLQVTFVEAFKSLSRYEPDRPLSLWLQGIAFRQAMSHLRRAKRWSWLRLAKDDENLDQPSDRASSEDEVIGRQLLACLYKAMEKLPAKKRVAFSLYALEGMGFTEIGDITDESPQTIRARVLSAREEVLEAFRRADHLAGIEVIEKIDKRAAVRGGAK